jgi:hypothetical protein
MTGKGKRKIPTSVAMLRLALVNHRGVLGIHVPGTLLSQLREIGIHVSRAQKKSQVA